MKKIFFVLSIITCVLVSCDKASSGNKNIIPADTEQNQNSLIKSNDSINNPPIVIDSLKNEPSKDSITQKNLSKDSLHSPETHIKKFKK
ncbi:MAG: hypothetical protein J6581_09425 [Apibacter sp.]|nr:hypothetical protein [Apibacter sp.]